MENFGQFLIKSAAWLSGFGLIYILFLQKERYFNLKRIYLLIGILASFLFPFINIHYTVELPSSSYVVEEGLTQAYINPQSGEVPRSNWPVLLAAIYMSGAVFMFFRLFIQWWKIRSSVRRSDVLHIGNIRLIRTEDYNSSFSFFNYVFINPELSDNEMKEIMNHELVHINQKHWFDLLLGEIMRLIQWINPLAWIYTALIRINHEYLADAAALQRTSDPAVYKAALLNQVFRSPVINLSNSFNSSVTKTRFEMMKNVITSPYRRLKVLLVIPVLALIFYAFALPEYKYLPVSPGTVSEIIMDLPEQVRLIRGEVHEKDGKPLAGAIIIVSGTSNGAVTGTDGRFVLSNVPDNAEIVISCRGFITKTVKADSGELKIELSEEIVVIGYARPKNSTDSTGLRFRNIEKPELNPIVILDGNEIDREELSKFSPNLISSVSVLKDQSAIALYGDKGKDGVIIITSKKRAGNDVVNETEKPAARTLPSKPLIIIDNMITDRSSLEGINPDMIESITVLKNTNLYGEEGKDGVISIKLKRGIQLEKNDSIGTSGEKPVSPESRKDVFLQSRPESNFSGTSRNTLLKFIAENTRYPEGAKKRRAEGKVYIIVKVAKGGIVRESRVIKADQVNLISMPEVVIVGYPYINPDDLRPNENANLAGTADLFEKETLRVANLLGNADVPEWKERDMEFAITLNFVLR